MAGAPPQQMAVVKRRQRRRRRRRRRHQRRRRRRRRPPVPLGRRSVDLGRTASSDWLQLWPMRRGPKAVTSSEPLAQVMDAICPNATTRRRRRRRRRRKDNEGGIVIRSEIRTEPERCTVPTRQRAFKDSFDVKVVGDGAETTAQVHKSPSMNQYGRPS